MILIVDVVIFLDRWGYGGGRGSGGRSGSSFSGSHKRFDNSRGYGNDY